MNTRKVGWLRNALEPLASVAYLVYFLLEGAGRARAGQFGGIEQWVPTVGIAIAIATSRLSPWVSMAVSSFTLLAQALLPDFRFDQNSWPTAVGFIAAFVGLGSTTSRIARHLALGVSVASGAAIGAMLGAALGADAQPETLAIGALFGAAAGLAGWVVGVAVGTTDERRALVRARERAEQELGLASAALGAIAERDRIAQDVHDIVANSLSVVIAQAEGARALADSPGVTSVALQAIAGSARAALVEVRMLIETLGEAPIGRALPGLSDIDELVGRMVEAGVDVRVHRSGEPRQLTPNQELNAYRITQEALTNALKYASPNEPTTLLLTWQEKGLTLEVVSRGTSGRASGGKTRGLTGMRERAAMAGGTLEIAGSAESFVVTAYIPGSALT
ncbi:MAG TPA: histidine kinase [Candidatus Lumbricidophila sp.]|nr:histidine kinase [Candidatus Lumbricidophila sp.]